MRTLYLLGVALLISAAAVMLLPSPFGGDASAATANVDVGDFYFKNAADHTTMIAAGDTVTWTWVGSAPHSVTADDNSFDDPAGSSQVTGTFSMQFNTAGSYAYHCRVHGAVNGQGMAGTIVVQAANTATATNTAVNTPVATDTPAGGTATNTRTSTPVTGTPADGAPTPSSPPVSMPVSPPVSPPPSPPRSDAAQALVGPDTGTGGTAERERDRTSWLIIAMALAGVATLSAAGVLARKRA